MLEPLRRKRDEAERKLKRYTELCEEQQDAIKNANQGDLSGDCEFQQFGKWINHYAEDFFKYCAQIADAERKEYNACFGR